ncbi:MAG: Atrophin-1 multi-domain protein [Burkholderiaceae bacterium]
MILAQPTGGKASPPANPRTVACARPLAARSSAVLCAIALCSPSAGATSTRADGFGSFERPFAADSPWNRRPVAPRLGDYRLPRTRYFPFVGIGRYSTGVFRCRVDDGPMRIEGQEPGRGVWIVDEGVSRAIELPCWPRDVRPAPGEDGHAEIVDERRGIVHSFWQLRRVGPGWRATQYAWSALAGRGWPDPAHNHQGARAAGVPTLGGLIRRHEVDDGEPLYRHVLAMSLDGSALRRGYVAPAASEDNDAESSYRGRIPMGSLMMLPPEFDASALATPALRKIARTLIEFGAAVVDRNTDTRFMIYVEQGADFDLHKGHWNSQAGDDLQRIAGALRPVVGQAGWRDGLDRVIGPAPAPNLLSMRGPWVAAEPGVESGREHRGRFDSWRQALVFDTATGTGSLRQRSSGSQRRTRWAAWTANAAYRLSVHGSAGTTLRLQFVDDQERVLWESRWLASGESQDFDAPQETRNPILSARNTAGANAWISGQLRRRDGAALAAR